MNETKYKEYRQVITGIINDSKLNKIFHFNEILYDGLIDIFIENIEEPSKKHNVIYYLLLFFPSILYNIICGFFEKKNYHLLNNNNVFVSTPSLYNRFLNIASEVQNSTVLYFPEFHSPLMKRHISEHQIKGNKVVIGYYSINHLIEIIFYNLKYVFVIYTFIHNCKNRIHIQEKDFIAKSVLFVLKYISYMVFFKSVVTKYVKNDNKIVWILDHDKSDASFVINHYKGRKRKRDSTITINHGSFSGFNLSYIKPISDYILCTSEREKYITLKYSNIENNRIISVGVPLQSFSTMKSAGGQYSKQDVSVMVLGASTDKNTCLEIQKRLICLLKNNKIKFKYRFRPASKQIDSYNLRNELSEEYISFNKSLYEDCCSANIIISFSLDALGECFRLHKPCVLMLDEEEYLSFNKVGDSSDNFIITCNETDILNFVNKRHDVSYNGATKNFIYNNFGCYYYDEVVNNIKLSITRILTNN